MSIILFIIVIALLAMIISSTVRIVPQAHAYVVERLGAYQGTWSVGLHVKVPFIDRVARKVNLKEQVVDFPPQASYPCGNFSDTSCLKPKKPEGS